MFIDLSVSYPEEELLIQKLVADSIEPLNDIRIIIKNHLLDAMEKMQTWFRIFKCQET